MNWHFKNDIMWVAHKHEKKTALLVTEEMQIRNHGLPFIYQIDKNSK